VRLYKLAAGQSHALGQGSLAYMYEHGRGGLAKNLDEAMRLYTLAARGGNEWSQQRLKRLGKSW
jgi:TPR repeat protein